MFWLFWKHFTDTYRQEGRGGGISEVLHGWLHLLSACGNEGIAVLDEELRCRHLSQNWRDMTGLMAQDGTSSVSLAPLMSGEDQEALKAYLDQAGCSDTVLRLQMQLVDGKWHWCEFDLVEACRDDNKGKSYTCLLRNVNELLLSREECEQARLEADIAAYSRSEFLANMNHELRTPLNAIIGFSQMIESGIYGDVGHPKYGEYIRSIQESGLSLLGKVNDLMEIASIDSGRMALNEAQWDLALIVKDSMEMYNQRALAQHVILYDNMPKKPVMVTVDRVRMLQALNNVMANAIQYNKVGGKVDIYCENRKDGGINLVVEDNGNGIAPLQLQNILDAFGQTNSFFARSRDCVGLGLALAKEIVKLHHGRIMIESESGKGTLLKIVLPVQRVAKKGVAGATACESEKLAG